MVNGFDFDAKRRHEIVLHARLVGAMDSEDRDRWLIPWTWHNRKTTDQVWAVMEAAKRMGGTINEVEASAIVKEASTTRRYMKADSLAMYLGVTFNQRQRLRLTTIGSVNVKKRERKEIRRIRNKIKKEMKRRANGARLRSEYEAKALSRTQPWRALRISRRTWERHRNRARDASAATPISLSLAKSDASAGTPFSLPPDDTLATARVEEGGAAVEIASLPQASEASGPPSSRTATTLAADRFASLPLELRLLALGLPVPEKKLGNLTVREVARRPWAQPSSNTKLPAAHWLRCIASMR